MLACFQWDLLKGFMQEQDMGREAEEGKGMTWADYLVLKTILVAVKENDLHEDKTKGSWRHSQGPMR